MTMLSTWRPHKWSQFWSLIASKAASTMRRFCSTVISVFSSRERMDAGLYRWITDAAVSLDRRTVDRTDPQIRVTQSLQDIHHVGPPHRRPPDRHRRVAA